VPDTLVLPVDDVDEDVLVEPLEELELVELCEFEEVDTEETDETDELDEDEDNDDVDEDEDVVVVVDVDVEEVSKTAAAPATTIITTITTMIATLLIAFTVRAFFLILDGDNRSAHCMSLFRICYHPEEQNCQTQILFRLSSGQPFFRFSRNSSYIIDNYC
jgi:hypothetical protein